MLRDANAVMGGTGPAQRLEPLHGPPTLDGLGIGWTAGQSPMGSS